MTCRQLDPNSSDRGHADGIVRGGCLLLLVVLAVTAGCAGRLPPIVPVGAAESERIAAALDLARQQADQCGCCLDMEVTVSLAASTLFGDRSVGVTGYLQVMFPSSLKFVGTNPLGQPVIILAVDGQRFVFIPVPDRRAYEGGVDAAKVSRYLPLGTEHGLELGWLFGRVPAVDQAALVAMSRDLDSEMYWLEFASNSDGITRRLLFDPETAEVSRYLLTDSGRTLADLRFSGFQPVMRPEVKGAASASDQPVACRLPSRIAARFAAHDSRATLEMSVVTAVTEFPVDDFSIRVPPGFERLVVK